MFLISKMVLIHQSKRFSDHHISVLTRPAVVWNIQWLCRPISTSNLVLKETQLPLTSLIEQKEFQDLKVFPTCMPITSTRNTWVHPLWWKPSSFFGLMCVVFHLHGPRISRYIDFCQMHGNCVFLFELVLGGELIIVDLMVNLIVINIGGAMWSSLDAMGKFCWDQQRLNGNRLFVVIYTYLEHHMRGIRDGSEEDELWVMYWCLYPTMGSSKNLFYFILVG